MELNTWDWSQIQSSNRFPKLTITILSQLTLRSPLASTVVRTALLPCVSTIPSRLGMLSRRPMSTMQKKDPSKENVLILGAAGRDFHDFITYWSILPNAQVQCFTGTQIPNIDKRTFPKEMCNNDQNGNKYPDGVKIYPEADMEHLIERLEIDTCALAYSDLSYDVVQSLASRANAAGAKFLQLPAKLTQIESTKPVISICASRTGVGKSQTTRYVAKYLKDKGLKVVAVRHPMPYDPNLNNQRCQRYEKEEDLDKYNCTVEEREEYVRHIEEGTLLFAGVDYPMILEEAEKEADVILWDGGNNDLPFFKPDLHICLVDSLRSTDEEHYYPGETNVRMADVVLVMKVNSLKDPTQADEHAENLKRIIKPGTKIFYGQSIVTPQAKDFTTGEPLCDEATEALVRGKRVLVVDDGPTLTHGGMAYGAGYVLAEQLGAGEIVEPRKYAHGSLVEVFNKFKHLSKVLPAMGYGDQQLHDLEATIKAAECDTIIFGTPSEIAHLLNMDKPSVVARYDLRLVDEHESQFHEALDTYFDRFGEHHQLHQNRAS